VAVCETQKPHRAESDSFRLLSCTRVGLVRLSRANQQFSVGDTGEAFLREPDALTAPVRFDERGTGNRAKAKPDTEVGTGKPNQKATGKILQPLRHVRQTLPVITH